MSNFSSAGNIVKKYRRELIFFLFFALVSSISFALGYLTRKEFFQAPIIIERCSDVSQRGS